MNKQVKQLILWAAKNPKSKESQLVFELISYIEYLEKQIKYKN